jgi:hypothetical protein
MHVGCPSNDDGANCTTVSSAACRDAIVMPLAPTADGFILLYAVPAVAIAAIREVGADTAIGRRALAPRIAAPPAHIVFCRLRR